MINNKIYQRIFDEISQYLISGWKKLIAYFEYGHDSYSFEFFEYVDGKYIKCFEIPEIDEDELLSSFEILNETIEPERNKLKKKWSNMTFIVDSKGKMKTDFDYTDLSENSYEYKKAWKQKYMPEPTNNNI